MNNELVLNARYCHHSTLYQILTHLKLWFGEKWTWSNGKIVIVYLVFWLKTILMSRHIPICLFDHTLNSQFNTNLINVNNIQTPIRNQISNTIISPNHAKYKFQDIYNLKIKQLVFLTWKTDELSQKKLKPLQSSHDALSTYWGFVMLEISTSNKVNLKFINKHKYYFTNRFCRVKLNLT